MRKGAAWLVAVVAMVAALLTGGGSLPAYAATDPVDLTSGAFRVVHATAQNPEQRLAPASDTASDGAGIWLWNQGANAADDAQYWTFEKIEDGSPYVWVSRQDDSLAVRADDAGKIWLAKKDAADKAQQWAIEQQADGTFTIKNVQTGTYVVTAAAKETQAVLGSTAQGWKLTPREATFSIALDQHVLRAGDRVEAKVAGKDAFGNDIDASQVTWKSSDEDVIAIEDGYLNVKKEGTATVTARWETRRPPPGSPRSRPPKSTRAPTAWTAW